MNTLNYIYFMDGERKMKPFTEATDFLKESLMNVNFEGVKAAIESGQVAKNIEFSFRAVNDTAPLSIAYCVTDCFIYLNGNRFIFNLQCVLYKDIETILSISKYLSDKGFQVFVHD